MNGLEAFNDMKAKLKLWTDECPTKKHSTLHGKTHIMGHGTPSVLDEQFVLLKQYWAVHKGSLGGYVTWETESSGSYGEVKSGKVWDFCVRCDTCNKATGFNNALKPPTFVYHVNAVPALAPVQPAAIVVSPSVVTAQGATGQATPGGPTVGLTKVN